MSNTPKQTLEEVLISVSQNPAITEKRDFQKILNTAFSGTWVTGTPPFFEILSAYKSLLVEGKIEDSLRMRRLLRRRAVRSLSGISVISLLSKPWSCPGKCVYCPTNPGLPKSYVPGEPAVMRAELNAFNPTRQVWNRLFSLEATGHSPEKCDVRIIGGTWGVYPKEYREEFVKAIFDAHTDFERLAFAIESEEAEVVESSGKKYSAFSVPKDFVPTVSSTLLEAQTRNSLSKNRVIGVAIETRPDCLDLEEIRFLRQLGITRIELGYQTTIDEINYASGRGHGNAEAIAATKLLKDAGFKIVCHMMPGLPGSTPEIDRISFYRVWADSDFRPDEVKLYPAVVVGNSELLNMYQRGEYTPLSDEILVPLMADLQGKIPHWARLNRSYRDIPATEIIAGSKRANLRQLVETEMAQKGIRAVDISAREVRASLVNPDGAILRETCYEASQGIEYYLEFIDSETETLFGHLRLRIPSGENTLPELKNLALIREIHVFGDQLGIGEASDKASQHRGFGKLLLSRAEEIVHSKYPNLEGISVIAGVGVWEYYKKWGYIIDELGYAVKRF